ncbi:MAG TPA: hypothetical protein VMA95_13745 [Streptosporangiaceae bacterium]|nr:hypothetical protein [Streptosporangiaceae bacterium]
MKEIPRRHWLAAILLIAGLALRVLVQFSYRPALFYIDTVRYLYDSGGNDPVGYRLPLKAILFLSDFDVVAAVQHLLGLAIAVAIYVVLLRRGVPRWLAALAIAPVLLDGYQLQMEQMVLPDVWFEALIVAGLVILLWKVGVPGYRYVIAAGLMLGISATFRQVGEILVLPGLIYLIAACRGWRTTLTRMAAFAAAFVLPILVYLTGSQILVGHFYLSHSGVTTTYGRMAWSADCATLRLPPAERGLCPTAAQRAHGPDWLEHSPGSPLRKYYEGPLSARASHLVASFNTAVLHQQPGRVLATYASDVIKLFSPAKKTFAGDTPLSRWQFQVRYPYLSPHATPVQVLPAIARYGGGRPYVWRPGAVFLRAYQLDGGYTPGPLLAFCVLAGLAGTAIAVVARFRPASLERCQLGLACLLFLFSGAAILLMSDLFEFSWRYQLPALVTLPPGAAAGLAEIARHARTGRHGDPEQLPQTSEQVRLGH